MSFNESTMAVSGSAVSVKGPHFWPPMLPHCIHGQKLNLQRMIHCTTPPPPPPPHTHTHTLHVTGIVTRWCPVLIGTSFLEWQVGKWPWVIMWDCGHTDFEWPDKF
jgi:hypothetical protein